MATMKVKLVSGTGERLASGWEGTCPACEQLGVFKSDYFDTDVGKAILRDVIDIFASKGFSLLDLLFNTEEATDVIGCPNCHHAMAICPNCKIAFSVNKDARTYHCPSCNGQLC